MSFDLDAALKDYIRLVNDQRQCLRQARKYVQNCERLAREAQKVEDRIEAAQERESIGLELFSEVADELGFRHHSAESLFDAMAEGDGGRHIRDPDRAVQRIRKGMS